MKKKVSRSTAPRGSKRMRAKAGREARVINRMVNPSKENARRLLHI